MAVAILAVQRQFITCETGFGKRYPFVDLHDDSFNLFFIVMNKISANASYTNILNTVNNHHTSVKLHGGRATW